MSGADSLGTGAEHRPLRIVIADDQAVVRQGLELLGGLPDIEVLGTAADGQQALDLVERHRPDAILLDLHMPVLDGIATTKRLVAERSEVAIVILTTYADDGSVLDALRAGARSYLTKDADRSDIAGALHAAARGLAVLDPGVQATLLAAMAAPTVAVAERKAHEHSAPQRGRHARAIPKELPDGLTQREAEILGIIARGMTNPEIGATLFLSSHTVKTHINRIFAKPDPATVWRPRDMPTSTTWHSLSRSGTATRFRRLPAQTALVGCHHRTGPVPRR